MDFRGFFPLALFNCVYIKQVKIEQTTVRVRSQNIKKCISSLKHLYSICHSHPWVSRLFLTLTRHEYIDTPGLCPSGHLCWDDCWTKLFSTFKVTNSFQIKFYVCNPKSHFTICLTGLQQTVQMWRLLPKDPRTGWGKKFKILKQRKIRNLRKTHRGGSFFLTWTYVQ